jgi:hypothetical protein
MLKKEQLNGVCHRWTAMHPEEFHPFNSQDPERLMQGEEIDLQLCKCIYYLFLSLQDKRVMPWKNINEDSVADITLLFLIEKE